MSNYVIAISKLMTAAYMANEMTKHAVYVNFWGHVNAIDVRISEGKIGSEQYNSTVETFSIALWNENTESVMREFEATTAYLDSLIKEAEPCGA